MALATVGSLLAGCSAAGAARAPDDEVAALRLSVPVHRPIWSDDRRVLLALAQGSTRVVKIAVTGGPDSPAAHTTLSEPLGDVGKNIAPSPVGADVFVPQPLLDRVAVVRVDDLRPVEFLRVGPSPEFVADDAGSRALLAMPPDGSTVTGVELHTNAPLPAYEVNAGPDAEIDAGKRGRRIDFHVSGPTGVAAYKGNPSAVEKKGEVPLSAETSAGDHVKPSRVYVAEKGTDRLFAVDTSRTSHGLEVVARTGVGQPIRHLGVDELRIYAATERKLVVFETNSYEGYSGEGFPHVETIHYRSALPTEALRHAPLSGLAVGPGRVYLTLRGEPYAVSVAKPTL